MSSKELIYLACPYRHENLLIQKKRCAAAAYITKELFAQGRQVFSPLTHNDLFARLHPEIPREQWLKFDLTILSHCTILMILKLEGWERSAGVQREIAFAKERGLIIEEIDPPPEGKMAPLMNPSFSVLLGKMTSIYQARDWDQFHSPKNMAIDLGSEVGEILDHFKWVTEEESKRLKPEILNQVKEEIGDAFRSLIYLAAKLGIDPVAAAEEKLPLLEQRYPVERAKGKSLKHTAGLGQSLNSIHLLVLALQIVSKLYHISFCQQKVK